MRRRVHACSRRSLVAIIVVVVVVVVVFILFFLFDGSSPRLEDRWNDVGFDARARILLSFTTTTTLCCVFFGPNSSRDLRDDLRRGLIFSKK